MIIKAKGYELMNFFFITHLSTFDSKVFLTLKIIDFENVSLIKGSNHTIRNHTCQLRPFFFNLKNILFKTYICLSKKY
jgi:hypothetical protein